MEPRNHSAHGLTYSPSKAPNQILRELPDDSLRLYSTRSDSPIVGDPRYVFVESGEAFGRDHAAAYAAADTTHLSFGSATLGLTHVLAHGGSAYLPERIAQAAIKARKLYLLENAPVFNRPAYLIVNEASAKGWPWFSDALLALNL